MWGKLIEKIKSFRNLITIIFFTVVLLIIAANVLAVSAESLTDGPLLESYIVSYSSTGTVVGTYETLAEAVSASVTTVPCTITATAVDLNIAETITIPSDKVITLTSNTSTPATIAQTLTEAETGVNEADVAAARHFIVQGTLVLEHIVLSGINLEADSELNNGGVYVRGELLINSGAAIEKCFRTSHGGGVFVDGRGAVIMAGGEIRDNTASHGGGIFFGGTLRMDGSESRIKNNTAGYGGGVYVQLGGDFSMEAGEISGNTANDGGGIYVYRTASFCMNGGEISDNTGIRRGGGVSVHSTGMFIFENGTISGNTTEEYGGGVFADGRMLIEGGVISGNTAAHGGGLYIWSDGDTTMIEGGRINSNTAEHFGGGIVVGGTLEMTGGEISENTAGTHGGGVFTSGIFRMKQGAITSNTTTYGGGVYLQFYGKFFMEGGQISGNEASYGGGGVYTYYSAAFTMENGEVSGNTAVRYGGGMYINKDGTMLMEAGTISSNTVGIDGGGIYTEDFSYQNPADTARYSNININSAAVFNGNSAAQEYAVPGNAAAFINLNGRLLNNNDINYQSSITVTYVGNNGTAEKEVRTYERFTAPITVTILADDGTGFTVPVNADYIEWNTEADGSGTAYRDGDTVDLDENLTLYAIWERYATLSIKKTIDSVSDKEEPFLFYLEYKKTAEGAVKKSFYGIVTVLAGDMTASVTFDMLEPGFYTVTEIDSNWQYQMDSSSSLRSREFELTADAGLIDTADYQNIRAGDNWISARDKVINKMNG